MPSLLGFGKRGYLANWAFGEGVGTIMLTKTHTMGNFSQIGGAFGCLMAKEIINGDFSPNSDHPTYTLFPILPQRDSMAITVASFQYAIFIKEGWG